MSIQHAVRYYLVASFADHSVIGPVAAKVEHKEQPYLHDLAQMRVYHETGSSFEPLDVGDILACALWNARSAIGKDVTDKIVVRAWQEVKWPMDEGDVIKKFIGAFLSEVPKTGQPELTVSEIFKSRGFQDYLNPTVPMGGR
jgi:hypothetical protein